MEKYLHNATGELLKEVIDTQAEGIRMSEADKTVAVDFYKYAVVGAELALSSLRLPYFYYPV